MEKTKKKKLIKTNKSLAHLPSSLSAFFLFPVLQLMSKDNNKPKCLHETFVIYHGRHRSRFRNASGKGPCLGGSRGA